MSLMTKHTKLATAAAGIAMAIVSAIGLFWWNKRYRSRKAENPYRYDAVDLYIEESFPASDAPSYSPTTRIGGIR